MAPFHAKNFVREPHHSANTKRKMTLAAHASLTNHCTKRTKWIIYKPDENETAYCVKEEHESPLQQRHGHDNNTHSSQRSVLTEDEQGFLFKYISRELFVTEQQQQQENENENDFDGSGENAQKRKNGTKSNTNGNNNNGNNGINTMKSCYVRPSVFNRLSNEQIESKIERFFRDQTHVDLVPLDNRGVGGESTTKSSSSSSSLSKKRKSELAATETVWTSFKQQPIRLTRKSKHVVDKLYPTSEEIAAAKRVEDEAKEAAAEAHSAMSFKRINSSFSSSLRNHRRKLAEQISENGNSGGKNSSNKRKRSDDSDDSSSDEEDSRFASCVVSFDDLTKGKKI